MTDYFTACNLVTIFLVVILVAYMGIITTLIKEYRFRKIMDPGSIDKKAVIMVWIMMVMMGICILYIGSYYIGSC